LALWHRLVKRNHITARYHTAVAFVILSRSLHATKKTTPTAAAAAAAPTAVERNLAEDDVVRGGGCEEEEGAAACPPSPSTPVTSASMKHGGVFLLRRDGSLVGMTVVKHRSAGLERKTRERTVTRTLPPPLHGQLMEALSRAMPSKKKAAVYPGTRLVRVRAVNWWDKTTNDFDEGGVLTTRTMSAQTISRAGVRLSSCLCY
jgi:hypothetical protein